MTRMPERKPESEQPNKLDAPAPRACPTCSVVVPGHVKNYPFCSDRCRMEELSNWFNERYVISRKAEEKDLDEGGS